MPSLIYLPMKAKIDFCLLFIICLKIQLEKNDKNG